MELTLKSTRLETARRGCFGLEVGKLGSRGEMECSREVRTEARSGKRWSVTSGVIGL